MRTLRFFAAALALLLAAGVNMASSSISDIVFAHTSSIEHVAANNVLHLYGMNTLPRNTILIFLQTGTAPTADPTVVDNTGAGAQAWGVAKGGVVGNQRICALCLPDCNAGINHITITLQASETFLGYFYLEVPDVTYGSVASIVDGSSSATLVSGTTVAAGVITTAADGDFVFQFGVSAGTLADSVYSKGASPWIALGKQRSSQVGSAPTMFLQYQIQQTHGNTLNPTYTFTQTGTPTSDTLAFALKRTPGNGAKKSGMYTARSLGCNVVAAQTSVTLDMPCVGNLRHIWAEGSDFHVSTIVDSDGNVYKGDSNSIPGLAVGNDSWRSLGVKPNDDLSGIVITWAGSNAQPGFIKVLDIVGASLNQGPNDCVQTVPNSGIQQAAGDLTFLNYAPLFPDGMCFFNLQIESHTVSGITSPTPADGLNADMAVLPSADGAGTTFEEDNCHGYWDYVGSPGGKNFVATIQHNTAGVNHWGVSITEYKAASSGTMLEEDGEWIHTVTPA